MRASRLAVAVLVLAVGAAGGASAAPPQGNAEAGHLKPSGPACFAVGGTCTHGFASDFPVLMDSEWGFRLGGFGGIERGMPITHAPVILVHGNNVDAGDWYPVLPVLHAKGYTDQEIYALSYNGLGCNNGTALYTQNPDAQQEHGTCSSSVTNDAHNVPDLNAFIRAVLDYTGATSFSIAAHSLGVTLARKVLADQTDLNARMERFVSIAGANHGTDFCPPGSESLVESCDEIAADTLFLHDLDLAIPGDSRFMTVYDGSGVVDIAYMGTYSQSPRLDAPGVLNCAYPGFYHNDLRMDPRIAKDYVDFLADGFSRCRTPPAPLPY